MHGYTPKEGQGIASFGFIWYNVEDENCKEVKELSIAEATALVQTSADEIHAMMSEK